MQLKKKNKSTQNKKVCTTTPNAIVFRFKSAINLITNYLTNHLYYTKFYGWLQEPQKEEEYGERT